MLERVAKDVSGSESPTGAVACCFPLRLIDGFGLFLPYVVLQFSDTWPCLKMEVSTESGVTVI